MIFDGANLVGFPEKSQIFLNSFVKNMLISNEFK